MPVRTLLLFSTTLSELMLKPNGLVFTELLVIKSFQIWGESQPSLLRSEIAWSEIMNKPPPFCTN